MFNFVAYWIMLVLGSVIGIFLLIYDILKRGAIVLSKHRYMRRFLGSILVLLGVIGLFVPIIPGVLFIIWGMVLLESVFFKNLADKIKKKYWEKQ